MNTETFNNLTLEEQKKFLEETAKDYKNFDQTQKEIIKDLIGEIPNSHLVDLWTTAGNTKEVDFYIDFYEIRGKDIFALIKNKINEQAKEINFLPPFKDKE